MPLTAEAGHLLERFDRAGVRSYDQMSVLEARATVAASKRLQGVKPELIEVEDLLVQGAEGYLPARLYRPSATPGLPLLVYFHGGGWVTGSLEIADIPCRGLALATGRAVVSVGYRLSPETPFPGPFEDCYAATLWLADQADALDVDRQRLAVCGDSAGGNLAAATCLAARDRRGPQIASQILLYPALVRTGAPGFPSHRENATGYGLTASGMAWFWDHYAPGLGPGPSPYASPLLAERLEDLPAALVVAAEYDVLRDEGLTYARRLREAQVPVEVVLYEGLIHGFFWLAGALEEGVLVTKAIAEWLEAGP